MMQKVKSVAAWFILYSPVIVASFISVRILHISSVSGLLILGTLTACYSTILEREFMPYIKNIISDGGYYYRVIAAVIIEKLNSVATVGELQCIVQEDIKHSLDIFRDIVLLILDNKGNFSGHSPRLSGSAGGQVEIPEEEFAWLNDYDGVVTDNLPEDKRLRMDLFPDGEVTLFSKIMYGRKMLGIMALGARRSQKRYCSDELKFIQQMSAAIAAILKKNLLIERAESRNVELELLNFRKTTYFVNLVHETKTPLAIIKNAMEDYIRKYGINKELEEIKYHIERLLRDMMNFMDSEKLQKGQILYNHGQVFNLSRFMLKKIDLFVNLARRKNIRLESRIKENVFVQADSSAIDRIMNNLLDNALKYNCVNGWVRVSLGQDGGKITLTVEDSGIGISKEHLETIFKPYHQLSHRKSNFQGLGMGLSIISEILKPLQGKITVESKEGEGSRFTILLPACPGKNPDKVAKDDITPSSPLAGVEYPGINNSGQDNIYRDTVLLVEDNASLLSYLRERVGSRYNVLCAANGREAMQVLRDFSKPSIIVTDIMMDEMNGYEFYDKLKEAKDYEDIPVIFLTAKTEIEENIEGLMKGAVDYIYKPFSMEVLLAKIESLLNNIRIRKELSDKDKFLSLGKLSARVTHEILNPLTGIKGPLDYMFRKINDSDLKNDEYIINSRESIYENIGRIELIVKNMRALLYNKNDVVEVIDLNPLVDSVIALILSRTEGRIRFRMDIKECFLVRMNSGALFQILMNLLNNAADGIENEGEVNISAEGGVGHFCIKITDTGKVMEAEEMDHLFMVRELAGRYKMELSIESQPGGGNSASLIYKG